MTGRKKRSKERPNKRKDSPKKVRPSQSNSSEAGPSTAAPSSVQSNIAPSNIGAQLEHTSLGDNSNIPQGSNYVLSTPQDSRRICAPQDAPQDAPQALPDYPRTLVNGRYYIHNPNSLPEPLNQGYLRWVNAEREASHESAPRHPGAARWNNRTLRYWRLATDFSRFLEDSEDEDTDELEPYTNNYNVTTGARSERIGAGDHDIPPRPAFKHPIPQRPYTAPPHHCDYVP